MRFAFVLGWLIGLPAFSAQGKDAEVRSVNPAENLTKFEVLPKFTVLDSDNWVSISTLTFKFDQAFQGIYGLNIALPAASFESPAADELGIGDLNQCARALPAQPWAMDVHRGRRGGVSHCNR